MAPERIQTLKSHADPPEHICDNLLHFLTPHCVTQSRRLCEKAAKVRQKRTAELEALKQELESLKENNAKAAKASESRKSPNVKKSGKARKEKSFADLNSLNKQIRTQIQLHCPTTSFELLGVGGSGVSHCHIATQCKSQIQKTPSARGAPSAFSLVGTFLPSIGRKLQEDVKNIGTSLINSLVEMMCTPGMIKKEVPDVNGKQAGLGLWLAAGGRADISTALTCQEFSFSSSSVTAMCVLMAFEFLWLRVDLRRLPNEPFLTMVAGSVCKDWSSMGKNQQWLGQHAMLCAIFIALTRTWAPALCIHECTPRFDYKMLHSLLRPEHEGFHQILSPSANGCPVQRTRAYDCLIHQRFKLPHGLSDLWKLCVPCVLDSGVWLQAPDDKALCLAR